MTNSTSLYSLEIQLTQHHISIDVLLNFFQLATLDRSHPDWRTTLDNQICTCIQLLGSVREPDLIKITGVDQPTINRRTRELSNAGTIRVARYGSRTVGKPAKWLQPPESADLDAEQRETCLSIAQLIIAYRAAWLTTQPAPAPPDSQPAQDQAVLAVDDQPELPTAPDLPAADHTDDAPPVPALPDLPAAPQPAPQRIITPAPMRPDPRSAVLASEITALPPLWYRSFYFWMTPLVALGLYSFVMNERAALVAFATQMGIPLLWFSGAIMLIGLLVEHRERIFASFYPVEHRALTLACGLIIAVAVVQSGLWAYARTLWTGTPTPDSQWVMPTMIPTPLVLPEMDIPRPTDACNHGGSARITAPTKLRIRQYPSTDAPIIGALEPDTFVTILCSEPISNEGITWVQIQQGNQYGWIAESANGIPYLTRP
jgi:hypothetical protein